MWHFQSHASYYCNSLDELLQELYVEQSYSTVCQCVCVCVCVCVCDSIATDVLSCPLNL